jgi:CubicO group peptidase (beta-lactamase class C family)
MTDHALGTSDRLEAWHAQRCASSAMIVLHHGQPLVRLGGCDRPVVVNSVRKSLLSALIGIAVSEGRIELGMTLADLDFDEWPGLSECEKTATIKDLVSARSGVYLPAPPPTSTLEYPLLRSRDGQAHWLYDARPERGAHDPGSRWWYSNWDFNVAGLLYERLTGKSIFLAFERLIARPLGMQHFDPFVHGEYRIRRDHLGATPQAPYFHFALSADDQARFGQLFLQHGRWGREQVVPEDWICESTTPVSKTGLPALFAHYGYMWWVEARPAAERARAYFAFGAHGHFIAVLPDLDAVLVLQSTSSDRTEQITEDDFEEAVILLRRLLPTITDMRLPCEYS